MNMHALVLALLLAATSVLGNDRPGPQLVEGDLIFQNSRSTQSAAILAATGSPYTHMGIVVRRSGELLVLEAGPTVREVPLQTWIGSGLGGAYALYRNDGIDAVQRAAMIADARRYLGRPYDVFFDFEGEAIYCSELPYLAFAAAGIAIGKVQTVADLKLDGPAAQGLIRERWRRHPRCAGLGMGDCVSAIMRQKLITPASIAADPQLRLVYSSFR
jgi:Permuted papain-like amidase enzyme, YaeF/YiiX, C92 family